jgi:hypothetical protein
MAQLHSVYVERRNGLAYPPQISVRLRPVDRPGGMAALTSTLVEQEAFRLLNLSETLIRQYWMKC